MLLRTLGVLHSFGMIALAVMLGGGAMRFGGILVEICRLVVVFLRHFGIAFASMLPAGANERSNGLFQFSKAIIRH